MLLETGRVGEQMFERNRCGESSWDFEIQILIDIGMQIKLALFHQLHHGCPGEEFASRPWVKERLVGHNWNFLF